MIDWPPPYTLRHSKRAKRIALRITAMHGLEVIVPIRKKIETGVAFLHEHRAWIEKQAEKMQWVFQPDHPALPEIMQLHAMNKEMEIIYRPISAAQCVSCDIQENRFVFYGAITDFATCVPLVMHWLKKQAKLFLSDLLQQYAEQYALPFNQMSIRAQKTRWGSCNAQGNIQLNYKLLFLPIELVHYVLVHELCHTKHLNHSKRFWTMLEKIIPDYRSCVKKLRDADQWIPRYLT